MVIPRTADRRGHSDSLSEQFLIKPHTMLIDQFLSDNGTQFRIFEDGSTYSVESLSLSGIYNITDGFTSFEDAEAFTQK